MSRKRTTTTPAIPEGLPGIEASGARFHISAFERAEVLEPITGLRDSDLRNIVNNARRPNGEPWFPKPVLAKFDVVKTLRGLLEYERARADRAKELPVYSSLEAMSTSTGVSIKLLKEWKKAGCPAFRARGDIVLEDLLRWLEPWLLGAADTDAEELKAEGVATWDEYRIKYQARNEKLKNQELQELSIAKQSAAETFREGVTVLETFFQKIFSEYPTLLEGRDKKQIRAIIDRDCKEKRLQLRSILENLSAQKRDAAKASALEKAA